VFLMEKGILQSWEKAVGICYLKVEGDYRRLQKKQAVAKKTPSQLEKEENSTEPKEHYYCNHQNSRKTRMDLQMFQFTAKEQGKPT